MRGVLAPHELDKKTRTRLFLDLGDQALIDVETMFRPHLSKDASYISLGGDLLDLYHQGPRVVKFQLDELLKDCGKSQSTWGGFYYNAKSQSVCLKTDRGWYKITTEAAEMISLPFASPIHMDFDKGEAIICHPTKNVASCHRFYLEQGLTEEQIKDKYFYRRSVDDGSEAKERVQGELLVGRDGIWDYGYSFNAAWFPGYDPSKYSIYNMYQGRKNIFDVRGLVFLGDELVFESKSRQEHILAYTPKQVVTYSIRGNGSESDIITINRYSHHHIRDKPRVVSPKELYKLETITDAEVEGYHDLRVDLGYCAILDGHELTVYDYSCL